LKETVRQYVFYAKDFISKYQMVELLQLKSDAVVKS
jgi:hypothetical protein